MHRGRIAYGPKDRGFNEDCPGLKGKHTEKECSLFRDEMLRRELCCELLGVGDEFRLITGRERPVAPESRQKHCAPPRGRMKRTPGKNEE